MVRTSLYVKNPGFPSSWAGREEESLELSWKRVFSVSSGGALLLASLCVPSVYFNPRKPGAGGNVCG